MLVGRMTIRSGSRSTSRALTQVLDNPAGRAARRQSGRPRARSRRRLRPRTSRRPTTVVGTGTPASCTGDAFVAAVAEGRRHHVRLRRRAGRRSRSRQTAKIFNDKGPKIVIDGGGQGHAERRRQGPHPLHEHLRRDAGVPTGAGRLQRPSHRRPAHRPEHHVRRRQREGLDDGEQRRRWRRDLRARRPPQGRQLALLQQRLRRPRLRRRRRRDPRARLLVARSRPVAGLRRQQHVRRQGRASATRARTAARSAASACRGTILNSLLLRQHGRSATAPTPGDGRQRRRDLQRRQRDRPQRHRQR